MLTRRFFGVQVLGALLAVLPGCGAAAAGPAARPVEPAGIPVTDADVRFMQGMIGHHAQAVTMAAMVPGRTRREDLRLLAERITVSQEDEIAAMRRWLEARGHGPAGATGHEHHGAAGTERMPGMLTDAELAALAAATDTAFDRLFLESMIRHHEGALVMVERLFGSQGAGQEPELFGFASDVDADQRAEIRRMRALLERISPGAGRS